jgi:hypothetical protein
MRKILLAVVTCGSLSWFILGGAPAAQAAHGCVNIADVVNIHGDTANPAVPDGALPPCTYNYVAGDTYSGGGTFDISCALTTGTVTTTVHYNTSPAQQLPFSCDPGTLVTVTAPGGFVSAGTAP